MIVDAVVGRIQIDYKKSFRQKLKQVSLSLAQIFTFTYFLFLCLQQRMHALSIKRLLLFHPRVEHCIFVDTTERKSKVASEDIVPHQKSDY